jgi:hypothetical protein
MTKKFVVSPVFYLTDLITKSQQVHPNEYIKIKEEDLCLLQNVEMQQDGTWSLFLFPLSLQEYKFLSLQEVALADRYLETERNSFV